MPRIIQGAIVALILTLVPTQAYGGEELKLSLYPQYSGNDRVIFADTQLMDSGESIVDDGEEIRSPFEGRGEQIEAFLGSSQNLVSGDWLAIFGGSVGVFKKISTPNTRTGESPYAQLDVRIEKRVYEGPKDDAGRQNFLYIGGSLLINGSVYEERFWESQVGMVALGASLTFGEGDGLMGKHGNPENFGRWVGNVQIMGAFRHQNGKTKDDTFELEHDRAFGIYASASFSFYGLRQLFGEHTEYLIDDDRWGKRRIYGYNAFLSSVDLNGYVFVPVDEDREDSIVNNTSEGPSNMFGYIGLTIDFVTLHATFFGTRFQWVPFSGGVNVRFQEQLDRNGTGFDLRFDPGLRIQMKLTIGERFSIDVFGDLVDQGLGWSGHRFAGDENHAIVGAGARFNF